MTFQVVAPSPPPQELTPTLFADITSSPYVIDTSYGTNLLIFQDDLTPTQQLQVRLRAGATSAQEASDLLAAFQAIDTIRTFNNLATPSNAQVLAEVKLLGNVCIRLIKNLLGDYSL